MSLATYVFPILNTAGDVVGKMFKKPHFRIPFNNQHVKWSQELLKSAQ